MGKRFVVGDVHGANKALVQVLERASFDFENDTLIQLGDVADGWSEVSQAVDTLLRCKNLISIKGNHDDWFLEWLTKGEHPISWLQGGEGTLKSYCKLADRQYIPRMGGYTSDLTALDIPLEHQSFWKNQRLFYTDGSNNFYVHGGFNRHHTVEQTLADEPFQFYWDRDLWLAALSYQGLKNTNPDPKIKFKIKDNFNEIFIGHTPTINWKNVNGPITVPIQAANIWNMDTGAGFKGKLTILDVSSHEYWQSDFVNELYSEEKGRT